MTATPELRAAVASLSIPPQIPVLRIAIVPDGDLIIDCGISEDKRKKFIVASKVLWMSSKVFHSMLGPESQFLEGELIRQNKPLGEITTVPFEADPDALELILKCLHLWHLNYTGTIPNNVPLETLVQLAQVADMYELQEALRPHVDMWILPYGGIDTPRSYESDEELGSWLFISWVFGIEEVFTDATQQLMFSKDWGDDSSYPECLPEPLSEAVAEKMRAYRKLAADKLYEYLAQTLDERRWHWYKYNGHIERVYCKEKIPRWECDTLQMGHLLQTLDRFGVRVRHYNEQGPAIVDRRHEIQCLKNTFVKLEEVEPVGFQRFCSPVHYYSPIQPHVNCGWVLGFKDFLTETLRGLQFSDFPSRVEQALDQN